MNKIPEKKENLSASLRGAAFILFFLVLALGVGVGLWLGVGKLRDMRPDLFVGKYESGRVRAQERTEDGLGWGSEILVDKKPAMPAQIRFMLRDKDKKPVTGAVVQIMFMRAENSKETLQFDLKADTPGVYRAQVPLPGPASWHVRVMVSVGGSAYQITRDMALP